MKRLKILPGKSPNEKIMYVLAVFILVAILLTFQKIAEVFSEAVSGVTGGKIVPPVPLVQATGANLAYIGGGIALLIFGSIIAVPIIKISVIVIGLVMVGIALRNVYRTFTGKPGETPLPNDLIKK